MVSVHASVHPLQLWGHCNSTAAGPIHSILSSMEPSWLIDMRWYGNLPVRPVWARQSCGANSCKHCKCTTVGSGRDTSNSMELFWPMCIGMVIGATGLSGDSGHPNSWEWSNSTSLGLIREISSLMGPSWLVNMQQQGYWPGTQILANDVTPQSLDRFAHLKLYRTVLVHRFRIVCIYQPKA